MIMQVRRKGSAALIAALVGQSIAPVLASGDNGQNDAKTTTPFKHVIVIIGENRSFDHVYATYKPKAGQTVDNLLSKHIVKADGSPGANYSLSGQYHAVDFGGTPDVFSISPQAKTVYNTAGFPMPPAMTGGAPTVASDTNPAPFATFPAAVANETDLPAAAVKVGGELTQYDDFLLTGATGLPTGAVDTRLPFANNLLEGVFQLTPFVRYDDYASSPVHRFYQMWQELDCNAAFATASNPSGCLSDLWPFVETSIGTGSNGTPPPAGFNVKTTGEGSTAMAFYNVQAGDAPYMKELADKYTLSDNFHQSVMGGTGANHIMLGFGDAIFYSDGNGHALPPPANQIENPNPQAGTNNFYDQDGYSGGSYSECADITQPGVPAVVNYLQSLARPVNPNCQSGRYYLLNNYNPGFMGNGTTAPLGPGQFTIPPTAVPHIGDSLLAKKISFKYYGEHWNRYVANPTDPLQRYCNICNFFQYASDIMTNTALRTAHVQDTDNLYADIQNNTLPAVSFVKPSGYTDGHPASSKLDLFEGFVEKIVSQVQANKELWKDTAILITFDEGGGYYDSGYVQPVDFFGDGTRIPLLVVSPYSKGGNVVHTYYDHVSILKFIEANWSLNPVSTRSRDNLPNPKTSAHNPYVPLNSPALGDLLDMFDFN
jgi:phospholipase C